MRATIQFQWNDPMQRSPNAVQSQRDGPMSAQAIGLGHGTIRVQSPNGAAPNSTDMKHAIVDDEQRIGPPRWGFLLVVVTVTQADGLGWHRAATLWRKTEG